MANIIEIGGGGSGVIVSKTISNNGVYNASSDNADGFNPVTVEVPQNVTGAIFDDILSEGVVSTNSAYATATFNDISAYEYIFIKVYDTVGGTDYVNTIGFPVSSIPENSYINFQLTLHTPINFQISRTSISSTNYSGAYYYIYADIVATEADVFDSGGSGGGIDYIESWIIKSQNTGTNIPTITTHLTYNDGIITSFDVAQNAGNATITSGDITTYIGDASNYKWKVTANDDMEYRIVDIINGTVSGLLSASSGDVIISDGIISGAYCMEIRRYS